MATQSKAGKGHKGIRSGAHKAYYAEQFGRTLRNKRNQQLSRERRAIRRKADKAAGIKYEPPLKKAVKKARVLPPLPPRQPMVAIIGYINKRPVLDLISKKDK